MSGLKIDFTTLDDTMLDDLPIGPAEEALNTHLGDGSHQSLHCFALLDAETQATIMEDATDIYAKMAEDTTFLMEYGQEEVDSMNKLIDTLFNKVDPIEIPEITEMTEKLTSAMGELHEKYNVKNPKILKAIDRAIEGKGRFFWSKADNHVQGMLYDARDTKGKVDMVHAELMDKKQHMLRNAAMYDQLYKTNQIEILKMIRIIATLEHVRVLA